MAYDVTASLVLTSGPKETPRMSTRLRLLFLAMALMRVTAVSSLALQPAKASSFNVPEMARGGEITCVIFVYS